MQFRLILLLCFSLSYGSFAQSGSEDRKHNDEEQKQLEWCYSYSNLFGYDIDTIRSLALFESVSEWLGTRYHYGGNSKKGVDCSGFVCELFKNVFDVSLEGNSADLYKKITPIKKSELHEGDLVFFKIRKKRISHLGVYLGQNKFVHASLKLGVTIDDLDDPYYKKYFYKGGRMDSRLSVVNSSDPIK